MDQFQRNPLAGIRLTRRAALQGMTAAGIAGALVGRGGLAVLAQEASPAAAVYPELLITAQEYSFDLPATVESGWTQITMDNHGLMDHHAMFMRVNDGSTLEDLEAALKGPDFGAIFAVSTSYGGPASGAGVRGSVILNLDPGQYVVICAIPDENGTPHYALGMQANIEVTEGTATAEAPTADTIVTLMEMMFHGIEDEVTAGAHLWEVKDIGQQVHEMGVNQIAPGLTFDQVHDMLLAPPPATPEGGAVASPMAMDEGAGAPPFTTVGGVAPMSPGQTNFAVLDLAPGDYFTICFVPDAETGAPHFALGMITPFTVS